MIEVRDAAIEDADALATAHIDSWRAAYRGVVPDEYLDADEFASSRRERWRAWTWPSRPESRMFVVTVHGRIAGFGHAGPEENPNDAADTPRRGEIYGFYLHPSAWGSGGAGALMSRCEEFLRDEGFGAAVLWVLRDNPRARAFYEKAGWHCTEQEKLYSPSTWPDSALPRIEYVVSEYEVRL